MFMKEATYQLNSETRSDARRTERAAPPHPLARGSELSRVMLVIQQAYSDLAEVGHHVLTRAF